MLRITRLESRVLPYVGPTGARLLPYGSTRFRNMQREVRYESGTSMRHGVFCASARGNRRLGSTLHIRWVLGRDESVAQGFPLVMSSKLALHQFRHCSSAGCLFY